MPPEFMEPEEDGPPFTKVPNDFLDWIAPELTEAELRLMLYVYRRTAGFRKTVDKIGLKQFCHGIRKRDGTPLDCGTGLTRQGVLGATQRLESLGLLSVVRKQRGGRSHVNEYAAQLPEHILRRIEGCRNGERVNVLDRFRAKRKGQPTRKRRVYGIDSSSPETANGVDPQKKGYIKKSAQEKEYTLSAKTNGFTQGLDSDPRGSTNGSALQGNIGPRPASGVQTSGNQTFADIWGGDQEMLLRDSPEMDSIVRKIAGLSGRPLRPGDEEKLRAKLCRYRTDDVDDAFFDFRDEMQSAEQETATPSMFLSYLRDWIRRRDAETYSGEQDYAAE